MHTHEHILAGIYMSCSKVLVKYYAFISAGKKSEKNITTSKVTNIIIITRHTQKGVRQIEKKNIN